MCNEATTYSPAPVAPEYIRNIAKATIADNLPDVDTFDKLGMTLAFSILESCRDLIRDDDDLLGDIEEVWGFREAYTWADGVAVLRGFALLPREDEGTTVAKVRLEGMYLHGAESYGWDTHQIEWVCHDLLDCQDPMLFNRLGVTVVTFSEAAHRVHGQLLAEAKAAAAA